MKKFGVLLFVLLILYFIFLIRQDIIDSLELKREKHRAATSIQQAEVQAKSLANRLKALQNDSYVESLARTRLGLIKKGETAYKVIGR
ncbi:MAG: septum formation initiator family protein [Candidatus Margulisbacteria bacterium]|nr:septum formation initiator family protein [Candidatus Margulisiibacteriota bacterium]